MKSNLMRAIVFKGGGLGRGGEGEGGVASCGNVEEAGWWCWGGVMMMCVCVCWGWGGWKKREAGGRRPVEGSIMMKKVSWQDLHSQAALCNSLSFDLAATTI